MEREKYQWPLKNAISKIDVSMDCFLLVKGQGKVREFLTS